MNANNHQPGRFRWRETAWTRTRALLSLGTVLGLGAVGTLAAWTSTATVETGIFSVGGTLELEVDDVKTLPVTFSSSAAGTLPLGGSIAGAFPVQNAGTVPFTYSISSGFTDPGLSNDAAGSSAAALAQNVTAAIFEGGSAQAGVCTGGTLIAAAGGGGKISGPSTWNPITSPATLAPGAEQDLCIQLTVASNAAPAARMAVMDVTFDFVATEA